MAAKGSVLDSTLDPIVLSTTYFAKNAPHDTAILLYFFVLEKLIELSLISRISFLKFVEHYTVQVVAAEHEKGREQERLHVHESTLEGCFFLVVKVQCLLSLASHLFVNSLLAKVCRLFSLELWTT